MPSAEGYVLRGGGHLGTTDGGMSLVSQGRRATADFHTPGEGKVRRLCQEHEVAGSIRGETFKQCGRRVNITVSVSNGESVASVVNV